MVKKVLVADTFGKAVNWGYANVLNLSGVDSALLILFYVLQLYFGFSVATVIWPGGWAGSLG